jgi:hypothetical protein
MGLFSIFLMGAAATLRGRTVRKARRLFRLLGRTSGPCHCIAAAKDTNPEIDKIFERFGVRPNSR